MENICDMLMSYASPIVAEMGYELMEVTFKNDGYKSMALTFFIDRDGGISLNDCEIVHKKMDVLLDELDKINEPYTLNISSCGIDRPLKNIRDYQKSLDKEVNITLHSKTDAGKKFVATLKAFDLEKGVISVQLKENLMEIEIKNISKIKPEIKF